MCSSYWGGLRSGVVLPAGVVSGARSAACVSACGEPSIIQNIRGALLLPRPAPPPQSSCHSHNPSTPPARSSHNPQLPLRYQFTVPTQLSNPRAPKIPPTPSTVTRTPSHPTPPYPHSGYQPSPTPQYHPQSPPTPQHLLHTPPPTAAPPQWATFTTLTQTKLMFKPCSQRSTPPPLSPETRGGAPTSTPTPCSRGRGRRGSLTPSYDPNNLARMKRGEAGGFNHRTSY